MRSPSPARSGSLLSRLLLSAAAIGAAASIAGLGAFATFTDSANASHSIDSGTVDISLDNTTATNNLTVGATDLAPGDTVQRRVDLHNDGSLDLASVTLTTVASPSSLLDTDATNGLQMIVHRCSVAWTEDTLTKTFTCSGTTDVILASRPVIGSNLALTGATLASLTAGGVDRLRVTLTLPATADNTFQGLSSTIAYTFDATQRNATSK